MNKYHNTKAELDGEKFDSLKELNRWAVLKLLEKKGHIRNLRRQVKYELVPATNINGKKERPVAYIADFVFEDNDGTHVEDTKGVRTKDYIIKRKLMAWRYGITIEEV